MRQQYFVCLLRGLFNDPGSSVLHGRAYLAAAHYDITAAALHKS
jgi:hypothetical protein